MISIVAFVIALCFVAGFIFASRAAKTTIQMFFLTILFGVVFMIALCGVAFAGCVALLVTGK